MAVSPPKLSLSSPVTALPRVGSHKAERLARLNITHIRDFLYTFPRRYDDFSKITPITDLKDGITATIRGRVKSVNTKPGFYGRRRLLRIFADIEDNTGVVSVIWFNLQFLPRQLWIGRPLAIAGKVEIVPPGKRPPGTPAYRLRSPVIEFTDQNSGTHTGRITPIYPETHGVTSRFLRYSVHYCLPLINTIPEYLPQEIIQRHNLIGIHQAVKTAHFPESSLALQQAQQRLRFDELFFLQLSALVRRRDRAKNSAFAISLGKGQKKFIQTLPFKLTNAQQVAIKEISRDLSRQIPMNRLLQGDVGSGKSAVSLIAAWQALAAGFKVFYLAPTEILARQQADTFREFLPDYKVEFLIGATKSRARKAIKTTLSSAQPYCLVGTHALLQENITAHKIGLVIIDEQHRFGVKQRQALQKHNQGQLPHLLSMTATPIPRTLNLTLYSDLDISILNEMPRGRRPIITHLIPPGRREKTYIEILDRLHHGRQAYVISPLVEESETLNIKSAKQAYAEIKQYFPDVAIALVHGQMPSEAKQAVMNNFSAGAIQLLVSTSVVEVGVNVPNATSMIIEGAERFGLAQLHQLRGRVGRGVDQSYCYLFPTGPEHVRNRRLCTLVAIDDGFKIAEEDLKLRGPGEVYGLSQSGFGGLKVASLLDYPLIKTTHAAATTLLKQDPTLSAHPILKAKVHQKNVQTHFE